MSNEAPFSVIAERQFQLRGPAERTVVVRVGVPEPDPAGPENSRCPFQVTGLSDDSIKYAYGVDSFQALTLAFVGIRNALERNATVLMAFHSDFSLTWLDTPWNLAIPVWIAVDDEQRLARLEAFIRGLHSPPPNDGEP